MVERARLSILNEILARHAGGAMSGIESRPASRDRLSRATAAPLFCYSHLRWDFVFQRPQHLMTRFARHRAVYFVEEPEFVPIDEAELTVCARDGVEVLKARLPAGVDGPRRDELMRRLIAGFARQRGITRPVLWFYTPAMVGFAPDIDDATVVYDCMDELANFRFAAPDLPERERALFRRADLVFTGGFSLYEAKRHLHANIHPCPSSVDRAHFAAARAPQRDPADQAVLSRPRFGFYGVIDERMDLALLAALADSRPEWQVVMLGPVVKIDPATLPRRANIAYLGAKSYAELPAYLAGWDVALMPFAINAATRFISPTKTPEYLAGGRPVVSTPIADVLRHYGDVAAVRVAGTPEAFAAACAAALTWSRGPATRLEAVDALLATQSWDETFARMRALLANAEPARRAPVARPVRPPAARSVSPSRRYDDLVVGAGFAGAVLAERLAAGSNRRVLVIDRRSHIGGNAFDQRNDAGLLVHRYGPHIFHTNSAEVFAYLSRFTKWRRYEHRVLASVDGRLVPIPINRTTLNALYGRRLDSDAEAQAFLDSLAEPVAELRTSEDVVVSRIGRDLYERFFRGYTRKQWGLDPADLDKAVTARIPVRTNTDDRYFGDRYQAMPRDGYTAMFRAMLDHPNITVALDTDFDELRDDDLADRVIFTGPIDEYFGHRLGRLPYRSLAFRHETLDQVQFQPVAVVNYPAESVPHTRITEYKHLTGDESRRTSVTYEYPCAVGDPYYPIPRPENQALFKRYEEMALAEAGAVFVGRLATYRYYNMDQVVAQALATYRRMQARTSTVAVDAVADERHAG
jgi:UDP-galactopyranose mutase